MKESRQIQHATSTICLPDIHLKLVKVNLKNNSRQYMHTCCFEGELRVFVLKIAVLKRKHWKVIFGTF